MPANFRGDRFWGVVRVSLRVFKRGLNMGFLTGIVGFIVTLILLRKRGGAGRHIMALIAGLAVSLALFGLWIAATIPPGGNYRADRLAAVWAFAIVVALIMQAVAMLIAMLLRRRAGSSATAPST